jgi:hypothetical protein
MDDDELLNHLWEKQMGLSHELDDLPATPTPIGPALVGWAICMVLVLLYARH